MKLKTKQNTILKNINIVFFIKNSNQGWKKIRFARDFPGNGVCLGYQFRESRRGKVLLIRHNYIRYTVYNMYLSMKFIILLKFYYFILYYILNCIQKFLTSPAIKIFYPRIGSIPEKPPKLSRLFPKRIAILTFN